MVLLLAAIKGRISQRRDEWNPERFEGEEVGRQEFDVKRDRDMKGIGMGRLDYEEGKGDGEAGL